MGGVKKVHAQGVVGRKIDQNPIRTGKGGSKRGGGEARLDAQKGPRQLTYCKKKKR